ncbi:MAG: DUF4280 domain-containing protein [Candidatus Pristimantibacillus sp.]
MDSRDTVLKKDTLAKLVESPWRSEDTYVTAGAYMSCSFGTHEEVLNKQDPNGVYINGSPMLTVDDCKVSKSEPGTIVDIPYLKMGREIDGNFYSFGYCRSALLPMKRAELEKGFTDSSYILDPGEGEPTFNQMIYPCSPKLLQNAPGSPFKSASGPQNGLPSALPSISAMLENFIGPQVQWTDGSPSVSIQGVAALTSKSCLFCQYGGKIRILTNGMDPAPPEFSER